MKTGKLSEAILKRSVLKEIKYNNGSVIEGSKVGQDASVIKLNENMAVAVNSVILNCELEAYVGISRVANDVACKGATPRIITTSLVLPTGYTEQRLKKLMRRIDECCTLNGVMLAAGHTETSPLVNAPCITFSCIGEKAVGSSKIKPGYDIIMTDYAGMEGMFILVNQFKDRIIEHYTERFYDNCVIDYKQLSCVDKIYKALDNGAGYVHNLSSGGVLNGLWELAEYGHCGIDVDMKLIPMKQEIIEICELYELNPYQLASGGSVLIAADSNLKLAGTLQALGVSATVIGRTTEGNERILRNEDEVRYLDEPKMDEILKIDLKS